MRQQSNKKAVALYVIVIAILSLIFSSFVLVISTQVSGDQSSECATEVISVNIDDVCKENATYFIPVTTTSDRSVDFLVNGSDAYSNEVLNSQATLHLKIPQKSQSEISIMPVYKDGENTYLCKAKVVSIPVEDIVQC